MTSNEQSQPPSTDPEPSMDKEHAEPSNSEPGLAEQYAEPDCAEPLDPRGIEASASLSAQDARLLSLLRSSTLLALLAASIAMGLGIKSEALFTKAYFWQNQALESARVNLLLAFALSLVVGGACLPLLSLLLRKSTRFVELARFWVCKSLPLGPLAIAPLLFDWQLWQHHPQIFLICVLLNALAMGAAVRAALSTEKLSELNPAQALWLATFKKRLLPPASLSTALGAPKTWLVLTALAAASYASWFSYHTSIWHLSAWSGYDLAIEDNILYNLLHGGPFFKASPTLGPTGSHFTRHSTLIAYALLPFYALHQSAETILVLQSLLMGSAAVPLFLFAQRRIGPRLGFLVALAYLMHPALQQSNLFEAHYLKYGLPFVWGLLWLMDSGRTKWALLFAGLTLSVREDVAAWVVMIGLWGAYTGRSFRLGLGLTAGASVYVVLMKLVIMPSMGGGETLMFMYKGFLPEGKTSYVWVLATAVSNPGFLLTQLLEDNKITYLLQILVPLGLLPLRHKIGWFALIPGGVFCLLATNYRALTDLHYQYSPHFLAFIFPALIIALEGSALPSLSNRLLRAVRAQKVAILLMAMAPASYQFGAVLQGNTSRGGPIPYHFGWHEMGEERRDSVKSLLEHLPADARVAASAFLIPQVSARPNAYSLSLGMYDADWLIAPLKPKEYVPSELPRVREALRNDWGVIAIEGPFIIAHRGHDQSLNRRVFKHIGRKKIPRGKRATGFFPRPPREKHDSK